jgi:hypothetical protein
MKSKPIEQRAMSKTQSVGTKLTAKQHVLLQERASERGLSVSEYTRFVLLESLYSPRELRILMAEFARLQHIVVSLVAGELRGEELTDREFQQIRSVAEKNKFQAADERIMAALRVPASASVLTALEGKAYE